MLSDEHRRGLLPKRFNRCQKKSFRLAQEMQRLESAAQECEGFMLRAGIVGVVSVDSQLESGVYSSKSFPIFFLQRIRCHQWPLKFCRLPLQFWSF